jgi:predicted enzyme related to lactoylglutathione lyase
MSNWIEIPVTDMQRARAFYEQVLGVELLPFELAGNRYALFPAKDRYNTGALVAGPGYVPSQSGPLVYLDASGRMDEVLARAVSAGAEVLLQKTYLSREAGEIVIFRDSEGNRIGLQSAVEEADETPVTDDSMHRLLGSAAPAHTFLVRKGPAWDDPSLAPLQWEHARNMFTLMKQGKLRFVCALMDGTDVLGLGILDAGSREEAEELLRDDPGVRAKRITMQLLNGTAFSASDVRF